MNEALNMDMHHLMAIANGASMQAHFSAWMLKHGKQYKSLAEYRFRRGVFSTNFFAAAKHNADDSQSYKRHLNHLADLESHEYQRHASCRRTSEKTQKFIESRRMDAASASLLKAGANLPDYIDWRTEGAVNKPFDQAWCGSCWACSAALAIESAHFMKHGVLPKLSEQQLMSCSWNATSNADGNQACDGGDSALGMEWYVNSNGGKVATEDSYPYIMADGYCKTDGLTTGAVMTNWTVLPSGDEDVMLQALATYGPMSISIDASHDSFGSYSSGVYDEPACSSTNLDHAVAVIGAGVDEESGKPYWLVQNSWSDNWGDDGYIRMVRGKNMCGIATEVAVAMVQ